MNTIPFKLSRYIGTKFIENGRSLNGLDCWGLLYVIYDECLGIKLPTYAHIDAKSLLSVVREMTSAVERNQSWYILTPEQPKQLFDVVCMGVRHTSIIGHVGLYLGPDRMLHADQGIGVVEQAISHPSVRDRVVAYCRYRKEENFGG